MKLSKVWHKKLDHLYFDKSEKRMFALLEKIILIIKALNVIAVQIVKHL